MSIGIWQLLLVLFILGIPAIAIALEHSGAVIGRKIFIYWIIGYVLSLNAVGFALGFIFEQPVSIIISVLFGVLATFVLYQAMVKRARDAGHGKGIVYLAIIPGVSLVVIIYLLFKSTKNA